MAAASLANIVKSSLGPLGLDKMLVDDIGVNKSKILKLILYFYYF
jgi:chaperonin GroEL (HSP60 family)